MSSALRDELRPTLALALPVVLGELGWMMLGVVDTLMVGRLGVEAIGAVSIGRLLFIAIGVFGIGLLLGMDTLVSQAHGAGKPTDCRRLLVQGFYLSVLQAVPLTAVLLAAIALTRRMEIDPAVLVPAMPYALILTWSVLPLLLYTTFRRYLQALGRVRAVMTALISANLVNVFFNWVLIFGKLGAPALGTEGAGWASVFSMSYMALFLGGAILHYHRKQNQRLRGDLAFEPTLLRRLLGLGFPAAMQLLLEVGVFATATALAGLVNPTALAAHHIALTASSLSYTVPLGISSAAAVRVGHAVGRRDPSGAGRAGWASLSVAMTFMLLAALVFVLLPESLIRLFTSDPGVISVGVTLLYIAAVFQIFDGAQAVATGALRGVGDTRNPLLWNLVGHWVLGLPVGYYLCFYRGWGVTGLWVGLSLGLTVVGLVLLRVWTRRVRLLRREIPADAAVPPGH